MPPVLTVRWRLKPADLALRNNHFLDDGMYLVTLLLIKAMQLKQRIGNLKIPSGWFEGARGKHGKSVCPYAVEKFALNGASPSRQVMD